MFTFYLTCFILSVFLTSGTKQTPKGNLNLFYWSGCNIGEKVLTDSKKSSPILLIMQVCFLFFPRVNISSTILKLIHNIPLKSTIFKPLRHLNLTD